LNPPSGLRRKIRSRGVLVRSFFNPCLSPMQCCFMSLAFVVVSTQNLPFVLAERIFFLSLFTSPCQTSCPLSVLSLFAPCFRRLSALETPFPSFHASTFFLWYPCDDFRILSAPPGFCRRWVIAPGLTAQTFSDPTRAPVFPWSFSFFLA